MTELVFENVFTPMEPAEIVALLSSLVFQQKNTSTPRLTPQLEEGAETMKKAAAFVARTQVNPPVIARAPHADHSSPCSHWRWSRSSVGWTHRWKSMCETSASVWSRSSTNGHAGPRLQRLQVRASEP